MLDKKTNVAIIGGGVTGTALLYNLSNYTNLKKIDLIERRSDFGMVASNCHSNSQTIHCGDIETNYNKENCKKISKKANMLRNFATKLPEHKQIKLIKRMQKMVLGVGKTECEQIAKRYQDLKDIYPNLKLADKEKLKEIEPALVYLDKNRRYERKEDILATYSPDEHCVINYGELTKIFVEKATEPQKGREINAHLNTEMTNIKRENNKYIIYTNKGKIEADFLVVSACGYSLVVAHKLGLAKNLSCLPVLGSFYLGPKLLNGKVYSVQDPELPFAAVHGDPDVSINNITRFGPTALPVAYLERDNRKTFFEFTQTLNLDYRILHFYLKQIADLKKLKYILKNTLFEIPILNTHIYKKDVAKIIPSIQASDLKYAKGFGGVRPQIVDLNLRNLVLGEGKIMPDNEPLIINITPSPGATTCLGNAEVDTKRIVSFFNCSFDQEKYNKTILSGMYEIKE